VLLAELLSSLASEITGKTLGLNFASPTLFVALLLGLIVVVLLAGAYPALALASFKTVNILKGKLALNTTNNGLRKGLVVFQFAISGLLIISALTVQLQIHFLKNKELGIDRQHVILQPTHEGLAEDFDLYRQLLLDIPGVADVSITNNNPLKQFNGTFGISWPGKEDPNENIMFGQVQTDGRFIDLLGLELLEGRNLSESMQADSNKLIINEKAASLMGMEQPVGQRVNWGEIPMEIIGMIKDYHFRPLNYEISPLIMVASGNYTPRYVLVKTEPQDLAATMESWETLHQQFASDYPFEYEFLDETFNQLYKS
ncbi:MAG: ABC transporter permease, partial [Bacteroidota bacterium]